jgi:hypothetical protein
MKVLPLQKMYSTALLSTVLGVREGDDPAALAAAQAQAALDLQKKIDEAVAAQTAGLKAKNDELLGKMKAAQDLAKQFEGLDPKVMKDLKDRLDQDEDAKLLAEGKKNVVIEKYTERMRAQHAAELEAERQRTLQETQRADAYRGSVLDNHIRSVTGGLHKGAVEDALLHARQIFSLDAKGNAVQLDSEGRPVLGKDGSTPFSPAEWIELQKETKPHWFPASSSGGGSSAGGTGGSGAGKTIKRADYDRLSPADQRTLAMNGSKIID